MNFTTEEPLYWPLLQLILPSLFVIPNWTYVTASQKMYNFHNLFKTGCTNVRWSISLQASWGLPTDFGRAYIPLKFMSQCRFSLSKRFKKWLCLIFWQSSWVAILPLFLWNAIFVKLTIYDSRVDISVFLYLHGPCWHSVDLF